MRMLARLGMWFVSCLTSILGWKKKRSKKAYDPHLRMKIRLSVPGDPSATLKIQHERWASVSRHGLVRLGITCPYCGHLAASSGDVGRIHQTRVGEAIHCGKCNAILVASPDDDVDPVSPGKKYDESVYHAFVRPPGCSNRQRITSDISKPGDWVVIITHAPLAFTGAQTPQDLFGSEGRVETVDAEAQNAVVALSGNHGIGGAGGGVNSGLGGCWATIPLAGIAPMVLPSLRVGDAVKLLRGQRVGQEGVIKEMFRGNLTVGGHTEAGAWDLSQVPIEHVEKLVRNEITY